MSNEFHEPKSQEEDQKLIDDSQRQGQIDWSAIYWKPKGNDFENVIRILPSIGKATYHLKMAKHFIPHEDRKESFICDRETYGEKCPACEKWDELFKARAETAEYYKPTVRGVFNVVDYSDEELKVRLWECPPVAVWKYIITIVGGKSRYNNLVGTKENTLEGRDLIVFFDPNARPQYKYKLQFEGTTIIKAESADKWLTEAKPLIVEELYPRTGYEVAKIKTFGTPKEREELRKKLREQAQSGGEGSASPAVSPREETESEPEEEDDEVAVLKRKLAEAEEKGKAKSAKKETSDDVKEPKKEEKKAEDTKETPEDVKKKVDAIRKKHQA